MSFQASKRPEKRRIEQQRQTKWGEGNITKSLVHNAERENLWPANWREARRWSGCCTTDFLVVTICWDDRG